MKGRNPSAGPLTAKQLVREARALLAKLAKDRAYLESEDSAEENPDDAIALFSDRNRYARPLSKFAPRLVAAMASRGWIEKRDTRWYLANAGAAWLKRQSAKDDPFREQHQLRGRATRLDEDGRPQSLPVNFGESPLGWLRRRKDKTGAALISEPEYQAGERLARDYYFAQLSPRVTANWASPQSSRRQRRAGPHHGAAITEGALAARQRLDLALDAVGPELSGLLIDVCCHHIGLSQAEKDQGWPQRSAKVILQIGLSRLARHYGLIMGQDDGRTRRIRQWGDDSYRPNLDAWC